MRSFKSLGLPLVAACFFSGATAFAQEPGAALQARIVELVAKLGPGHVNTHFMGKGWGEGSEANEAAAELARIGEPVVEFVIPVLKDKMDWRRGFALEILEHVLDRRAVLPACDVLLHDSSEAVRGRAAELLGKLEDRRATNALISGLNDITTYVRSRSAEAIGRIRDPRAVPALIELVGSGDDRSAVESYRPVRDGVDALVAIGTPALPELRRALSSKREFTRAHAATALGRLHDKTSAEGLLALLDDISIYVRAHAAVALGQIQEQRATARIIPSLSLPRIVGLRTYSIADMGDSAVEALGYMGDPAGVEPLIALIGKEGWPPWLVAEALGRTKDLRVIVPLLNWKRDDGTPEGDALLALADFKDERIDLALMAAAKRGAKNPAQSLAIEVLGKRGTNAALPLLEEVLTHRDPDDYSIYIKAAEAIGRIDHARLVRLLDSPNESVRIGVIQALGAMGTVEDAPLIAPFLKDESLRSFTIYALGKLKPANGLALVTPFLDGKEGYARSAALSVVDRLQVAERTARLTKQP